MTLQTCSALEGSVRNRKIWASNLRVLRLLKDLLKSSQNYKYQTYKLLINQ